MRKMVLVVLALIAGASSGERAHACSVSPAPYWTIETIFPADGATEVPLDAVIGLGLRYWPGTAQGGSSVDVRVVDVATGEAVPGALDLNGFQFDGRRVWRPSASLRPRTQYRVEVTIASTNLPLDVVGADRAAATFTTSGQPSEPLRLDGSLRAHLRAAMLPMTVCGPCSYSCMEAGLRPAIVADVEAPVVSGGLEALGYAAWLTLDDRGARVFDGPGEGQIEGEHSVELVQGASPRPNVADALTMEIPREDPNRELCLGWNAWDAAGHSKSAEPRCFTAAEVDAAFAKLDADRAVILDGGEAPEQGKGDGESDAPDAAPGDAPTDSASRDAAPGVGADGGDSISGPAEAGADAADAPRSVHVSACWVGVIGQPSGARAMAWLGWLAALIVLRRRR